MGTAGNTRDRTLDELVRVDVKVGQRNGRTTDYDTSSEAPAADVLRVARVWLRFGLADRTTLHRARRITDRR